jgi:hypothetical protein
MTDVNTPLVSLSISSSQFRKEKYKTKLVTPLFLLKGDSAEKFTATSYSDKITCIKLQGAKKGCLNSR